MISSIRIRLFLLAFVTCSLVLFGSWKITQTNAQCRTGDDTACFDNKTNGFELQGKFDQDKDKFDETEAVLRILPNQKGGLGPVYNSTSCVSCHQNSGFVIKSPVLRASDAVSGSSSQVLEIRAGHNEQGAGGQIFFRDAPGGSVIQQRAIDPKVQERVPDVENIRTLRIATNTLGDGFVESIPDLDIIRVRDAQKDDVRGVANFVPVAVAPIISGNQVVDFVFESRIGRFGWKSQEASLLNFSANAYVTEMGITSPLQKIENSSLGRSVAEFDTVDDPEDEAVLNFIPQHPFGDDVEGFTRFMRSTKAPPQADVIEPDNVRRGREIFETIGCAECHVRQFKTAPLGTRFGDFTVPEALAGKTIQPYSDFLLHDIGTGDGIVQLQYAELPPTGLVRAVTYPAISRSGSLEQKVSVDVDYERLNALLRGEGDPKYRDRPEYRQMLMKNELRSLRNLSPAIQVFNAARVSTTRVGWLGAMSLRINDTFLLDMLYSTETAQMIRTAPLWGLRTRPQLLHDGRAFTLLDAIKEHRKQAERARFRFDALTSAEQQLVLDFLNFL